MISSHTLISFSRKFCGFRHKAEQAGSSSGRVGSWAKRGSFSRAESWWAQAETAKNRSVKSWWEPEEPVARPELRDSNCQPDYAQQQQGVEMLCSQGCCRSVGCRERFPLQRKQEKDRDAKQAHGSDENVLAPRHCLPGEGAETMGLDAARIGRVARHQTNSLPTARLLPAGHGPVPPVWQSLQVTC